MKERRKKSGAIVFAIIVIIAIAVALYKFFAGETSCDFDFQNYKKNESRPFQKNYVAVLYIEGVIENENQTYNHTWFLNTVKKITDDEKNAALVVCINSPGGSVYEADEAYCALCKYAKKTQRPVYAYLASLAASGGYYIACAADKIYANRNTLTGSIGVIASQSIDATELLQKLGIKMTTITAGKNKNMMNINSPLSDEQKDIMQSIADEAYEQFTNIVSEARSLPIAKVRTLADGRIYSAAQAKKNKLIDGIKNRDEMTDMLEEQFGSAVRFVSFRYKKRNALDFPTMQSSFTKNIRIALSDIAKPLFSKVRYPAYLYLGK